MNGITVRLHWTNQPYTWHINDGEEVFAVMDGEVDMHYRENGEEHIVQLKSGDIFYAGIGNGTRRPSVRRSADFGDREKKAVFEVV